MISSTAAQNKPILWLIFSNTIIGHKQNYWSVFTEFSPQKIDFWSKLIPSLAGLMQEFCKVCPTGHTCFTPVFINCSCFKNFCKGVWGSTTLGLLNKHQLKNSLSLTCIASVPSWGVIQPWPGPVSQAGQTQVQ